MGLAQQIMSENKEAQEEHDRQVERNKQATEEFFEGGRQLYLLHMEQYNELVEFLKTRPDLVRAVEVTTIARCMIIGKIGVMQEFVASTRQAKGKIYKISYGGSIDRAKSIGTGLFPLVGRVVGVEEIDIEYLFDEINKFLNVGKKTVDVAQQ